MAKAEGRHGSKVEAYELPLRPALFSRKLLAWYDGNRRDLPWRQSRDTYHIWVSEIMLQQTQIATALPYYERFIRTYPTLESLARAEEAEVLSNWAGLGYYSRARNLHSAARLVCENFGGEFPADFDQALSLPGIGRYTAGAILSIAFGLPYPVLDGNVRRLLTRYLCIQESNPERVAVRLWALLSEMMTCPSIIRRVGDFNQALMEFGSQVCTPRNPRCQACPLADSCRAFKAGLETTLPRPRKRRASEKFEYTVALVEKSNTYLLTQRQNGNLLEGFWDFPRIPGPPDSSLVRRFRNIHGLCLDPTGQLDSVAHQITFRKLTFHPILANLKGTPPPGFTWTAPSRKDYPVPAYVNKILKQCSKERPR